LPGKVDKTKLAAFKLTSAEKALLFKEGSVPLQDG
jgi:hypothetical protein